MENFTLFNLLKMLGGIGEPQNASEREDLREENSSDKTELPAAPQRQPAQNIAADVIERHERLAGKIKNRK